MKKQIKKRAKALGRYYKHTARQAALCATATTICAVATCASAAALAIAPVVPTKKLNAYSNRIEQKQRQKQKQEKR